MGKFYAFLLGVLAGCGLYHMASSYHFVRAESGFYMMPKLAQGLDDTYVDIRHFGPADWAKHPELSAATLKSGNETLVTGAAQTAIDQTLQGVLPQADKANQD